MLFFRLLEISVIHSAKCKLPSIREICICMLVYAYENCIIVLYLVITLLDLKNAFGEIHHNLIQEVLNYHHVPEHIKYLIRSLYTDFKTSILTYDFHIPFITVGRGVLQGDCLSHLLFNLCFNTFIQHIKSEKFRQCGFYNKSIVSGTLFSLRPIHWFQFADDAAVIIGQESENQVLLNRFTLWC